LGSSHVSKSLITVQARKGYRARKQKSAHQPLVSGRFKVLLPLIKPILYSLSAISDVAMSYTSLPLLGIHDLPYFYRKPRGASQEIVGGLRIARPVEYIMCGHPLLREYFTHQPLALCFLTQNSTSLRFEAKQIVLYLRLRAPTFILERVYAFCLQPRTSNLKRLTRNL
jgi:hypothetical protein